MFKNKIYIYIYILGEAVKLMDQYFERMKKLRSIGYTATPQAMTGQTTTTKDVLPQRIRFLLQDCIDLRANHWLPRQTQLDQAPKTMNEVRNNTYGGGGDELNKQQASMEAAALLAASQNVYGVPTTYLTTAASASSTIMMNMLQHFSQQPNMTLLNAINGMTSSKMLSRQKNKADMEAKASGSGSSESITDVDEQIKYQASEEPCNESRLLNDKAHTNGNANNNSTNNGFNSNNNSNSNSNNHGQTTHNMTSKEIYKKKICL